MKNEIRVFKYSLKGKTWKSRGSAGWWFVTFPKSVSKKIREVHSDSEEGWGRLRVTATIGDTRWKTSIWFDTKIDSYLIPVKASIRKKESISMGNEISIKIEIQFDDWFFTCK